MAFERMREAFQKVAKEEAGRLSENRTKNYVKEYRLLAAHHCASRRARRCHGVIFVPKLQQFSSGGLRVVGFRCEEALQLV